MKKRNSRKGWMWGILLTLLALSFVFAMVTVTQGAYTNSQRAQRTIAVYDAGGDRFSSNYLNAGNSRDNVRTLLVDSASDLPSTVVTVCNFPQSNHNLTNEQNVD